MINATGSTGGCSLTGAACLAAVGGSLGRCGSGPPGSGQLGVAVMQTATERFQSRVGNIKTGIDPVKVKAEFRHQLIPPQAGAL